MSIRVRMSISFHTDTTHAAFDVSTTGHPHIVTQVGSHTGVVLSIDSRYVRLQTDDMQQILLPSYQVYSQAIVIQEKTDKLGRPIPAAGPSAAAGAAATAAGTTPPSR